jgi:uncharacterized protein YegP (UPF0339 family)
MIVEVYSRKPLLGRRQWRWRAVHDNGRIMATSGEGYNNEGDCRNAIRTLSRLFPKAIVQ